ncbi:GTP-binding protein ERG [Apostasia shenzhenica]|uniref:GTP-binding protein ERG n=1 Tax=Apostasia shenzhenica TaxID=1088818 RepID=A0A2I0ANF6_9ASPA|nr:GTP-binding protein ERG [Apostasia shenzhenica]
MKVFRAAKVISPSSSSIFSSHSHDLLRRIVPDFLERSYATACSEKTAASAAASSEDDAAPDFDSRDFSLPSSSSSGSVATTSRGAKQHLCHIWDDKYRVKADQVLFGKSNKLPVSHEPKEGEEKDKMRAKVLARALLEAALLPPDDAEEEDMLVKLEDQRSLNVGIVGAPNAGKSSLTNTMVGTKVAAVSRKTNTTTHEVLGVMTKGNTQILFFDTPGLMIGHHGYPYRADVKVRVESAWSSIELYDLLIVMFDVHRHLTNPDTRVIRLIKNLGDKSHPRQKRVLCINKVDLVEDKKDLLKVAKEFEDLPGYERYFMISGLKGSGVKDLVQYLMEQATNRPWDEKPNLMTEEIMKTISLEVVREKMLDHIHQEIPYVIEHRLMDWKELRDGSVRVEQHFITPKPSQRQILVGKNGSKIGRIGIEANDELRSIFKREVHLILQVRVARKKSA